LGGLLFGAILGISACASPAATPAQPATSATAAPAAKPTSVAPASAASSPATQASPVAAASPAAVASPAAASPADQAIAKLNLNTATAEQFRTIPGVGDRMVREFDEYRPYTSIQQFRREIGKYVSQEQVAAYEQYVYVPVDPNNADAETLRQLPGVDASIAAQLIAGRPYASTEAFLARLGQLVSADLALAARALLATS
jgi:DNA uptake protein ComE-like DNA-binding protein